MAQIKVGNKVRYEIMDYSFVKHKRRTVQGIITQIEGETLNYCWIKRYGSNKEDFRGINAITLIKIQSKLK